MPVDSAQPRWAREQIAAEVRQLIQAGELGPRLPSEMALAERFGVSHTTIQRALAILKAEGLVESVPGLGTFVK